MGNTLQHVPQKSAVLPQSPPPTHTHTHTHPPPHPLCPGPLSYQASYLPGFSNHVRKSTLKNMQLVIENKGHKIACFNVNLKYFFTSHLEVFGTSIVYCFSSIQSSSSQGGGTQIRGAYTHTSLLGTPGNGEPWLLVDCVCVAHLLPSVSEGDTKHSL